jgi:hypothetical protein
MRTHGRSQLKWTALWLLPLLAGCAPQKHVLEADGTLPIGTWGGENAGILLAGDAAHVHIGCTNGNFPAPLVLDASRRFTVAGSYVLRAYPVQQGPDLPAEISGVLSGDKLTFTVAVNDTVLQRDTVIGPVSVYFQREPRMQNCPICRTPPARF